MAGQIEGKLHTSVPQAMGVQVAHSMHSSWGMSVVFFYDVIGACLRYDIIIANVECYI